MQLSILHSLRFRLTILCVMLAFLPLSIVGGLLTYTSYQLQRDAVLTFEKQLSIHNAQEASAFSPQLAALLIQTASIAKLPDLTYQEQRDVLTKLVANNASIDEVSLLDAGGREQLRIDRTEIYSAADMRERAYESAIAEAIATRRTAYGPVRKHGRMNEPVMQIAVPVISPERGDVVQVLNAEILLHPFWDMVKSVEFAGHSTVTSAIVDDQGRLIAHSDPTLVMQGAVVPLPAQEGHQKNHAGEDVLRMTEPFRIGSRKYYALAEMPLREALAPANATLIAALTQLGIASLLAIGAGVFVVRRVVRPVQALARDARAIADGDLAHQITTTGRDEVGELSRSFAIMLERLREMMNTLEDRIDERTKELRLALDEVEAQARDQALLLAENSLQRETIRQMSIPVLPISDSTLVMPLIGTLDQERLQQVQMHALHSLERTSAHRLVLDITGVPFVDEDVARGLVAVMQAAQLLGTTVIMVGIRPEVAHSLVSTGTDLKGMRTATTLQEGLRAVV